MAVHIVMPDAHALPGKNNNRAILVGNLINDVRPDTFIDLGDSADMPSLCSYDKGKRAFQGRSYAADINAYLDFQDKLWSTVKKSKRKLPRRVRLIGNHEQRIERALDLQPELQGTISYDDYEWDRYYSDVVHYHGGTPGSIVVDGVSYAHYFTSGLMGRPVGGEHPAFTLLQKGMQSATQGHSHLFDFCIRTRRDGSKAMGLVGGCFIDYDPEWPGEAGKLWSSGVIIKRGVENGQYDLEWVSMARLQKEYGHAL